MAEPKRHLVRRFPPWVGRASAVVLPVVATLLSRASLPLIESTLFIFYFPAVAASTWLGGLSAGLIATVLSVALADYFVIAPLHVMYPIAQSDVLRLALFAFFAIVISRFSAVLLRARDRAEALARNLSEREEHLKEQLDEGQVLTEELEEANEALQGANHRLHLAQTRNTHLFSLATRLSAAATPEEVAQVMFREGLAAVGADAGSLGVLADDPSGVAHIEMTHSQGYSATVTARYHRVPLTAGRPMSDALISRSPVLIGSMAEWKARYPETHAAIESLGYDSFAAVPIILGDRSVACVTYSFRERRVFDGETRAFLETMAQVCAQAFERARAFEADSRSRQRAATIVEAIADGFVAFNRDFRFTYVNGQAAAMWGRPASTLIGLTPYEAFKEDGSSPVIAFLERTLREQRVSSFEDYAPTLRRWIEMRAYPSDDGGVVVFFQDVTARRRSQHATEFLAEASRLLTSSSNYTETLANLAKAAVPRLGDWCAVDILDDPASTAWPPALRRVAVVHQDPEKIELGTRMMTLYPTNWDSDVGLAPVIRNGQPMFIPTITDDMIRAGARDERHLEMMRALQFNSVIAVPIMARGRVLGSLTLCMTESGRRFADEDLALAEDLASRAGVAIDNARLLRDAETANATKTEFLRTISHELRQPLNATVSFLQLWELGLRGPLNEQQREDLVRVQRNQRHLMSLIEDLLSFTRLEAGRLDVECAPVVMDDALLGLEAMIAPQMAARGVQFVYESCGDGIVALGDRDRIVQIGLNLLTNALRATSRGGRVQMECSQGDDSVSLIVADTGVGIPPDKLDSIFSPFTQLGRALNQPKEGAGLGLAISRGLAEAMRGTLTATSAEGIGSTFVLQLPRA
jgi:PAS domain S-box-containing protein